MKQLSLEWTKHIRDPQKKKDFETTIRNSSVIVDRLREILIEWDQEISNSQIKDDFNEPAYAYHQAAYNADRRRIKKLIDLLSFNKG